MSETAEPGAAYPGNWRAPVAVSAELFAGLESAPPKARAGQALNVERLLERCLGSRQLVDKVLQTFADRFSADLEVIRVEIEAGSGERSAKAAHRLKGACANAAADELAELVADLETAARAEQLDQTQKLFRELPSAWSRFVTARETFRREAVADMAGVTQ
jgi:HPt (histidine-containing phosphotransfer) domain-containing protein